MKVACFDLDGTILEPGGSIRHALDVAIRSGGFKPFADDEILIGLPLRDILRTRTDDETAIEAMVDEYRRAHMEDSWKLAHYHDGFPELIQQVRDLGIATAVVTTKGELEAIQLMEDLGIADLWDTIVGDDDVRPLKPDPAPVIAACGRLGQHPSRAVMIGDTSFDMDAGRAAGAHTIGVMWGSGARWDVAPTGGAVVVDSAEALLEQIQQWSNNLAD